MFKKVLEGIAVGGLVVSAVIGLWALLTAIALAFAYGAFLLVRWFCLLVGLDVHTATILGVIAAVLIFVSSAFNSSKKS